MKPVKEYYKCPICKALVCELPILCPICNCMLADLTSFRRAQHHVNPLQNFGERQVDASRYETCEHVLRFVDE